MTHDQSALLQPHLTPRTVTAPWCGGPGTLFSWECLHSAGSPSGITDDEAAAVRAVNDILRVHGGEGLVQKCRRGGEHGPHERDQYDYGNVVGRARIEDGAVVWSVP